MANTTLEFLSLASRTASDASASQGGTNYRSAVFELRISNVSGTLPTLNVTIQHSQDGSNWSDLYSFAEQIAIATVWYGVPNDTEWGFGRYLRINYTLGGTTPNFTFSVIASMREV